MRMVFLLFTTLPVTALAQTQSVSIGVVGGVPAQTPFNNTRIMPFVIGPTAEFRIFKILSLETGILYRRLGTSNDSLAFNSPEGGTVLATNSFRGWALDVPILAKYRLLSERRTFRPFFSAGPTVRRTSIENAFSSALRTPIALGGIPSYQYTRVNWKVDPTVGAGVDIRAGRFHIEPEVRYSYWNAGSEGPVRKNQVDFLIRFRR